MNAPAVDLDREPCAGCAGCDECCPAPSLTGDGVLKAWRGPESLTDDQWKRYRTRQLSDHASPRLRAYVERLGDGPTALWAWYCAELETTGGAMAYREPDRARGRDEWESRKTPGQIRDRVRRLARDWRPVGAFSTAEEHNRAHKPRIVGVKVVRPTAGGEE